MIKKISLEDTIYDICTNYNEIIDILKNLGFVSITNPIMLNTVGKVMTIPKGAALQNINLDIIQAKLIEMGFEII